MDSMSRGGVEERTITKVPETWYERNRSVENRGRTVEDLYDELLFTAKLVREDADNKYAWSHRQWALEALGKGYADELGFCNEILDRKHNIHNKLVWDQRCFAVKKCLSSGLMIIRSCEVTIATNHISLNPENECPWRYLRFLCKGEMDALAKNVHLHWALKCVFVEARERRQAVTADYTLHKNKRHAGLFDSVNKRGCLFALDLVSDLLSHGYEPHKEVVDAIEYLFEGPTFAERVDIVLRKHGMEVMELSADLTRTIINMPGGMEASGYTTPLSDHLNNPNDFSWSEDRWVIQEVCTTSGCVGCVGCVGRKHLPGSYSQLCGVAGFSQRPVKFFPEDPSLFESMKKVRDRIDGEKRRDTGQVTDDEGGFPLDYDGEYKDLPGLLRNFCWDVTNLPDFDFDKHTKALVCREGHDNPAAWQSRRLVIHARKLDLQKEVEILELLSERSSDNYLYWHQRRWVSEKIGRTAAEKELEITDKILSKDAYNCQAWSHRQWVLEVLGVGWEFELEYCNKFLEKDSSNCFAWNQRYFVAKRRETMLREEVEYATNAIKSEPENEMPWTYLQSLVKLDNSCFQFDWLGSTCGLVLSEFAEGEARERGKAKSRLLKRDANHKKRVVNALKMLVFALRKCPESVDSDMFRSLWPSQGSLEQDISQTLKSIDVTWI